MFHVRGVADYDILLGQQEFTSESKSAGEDFFIDASLGALYNWWPEVVGAYLQCIASSCDSNPYALY